MITIIINNCSGSNSSSGSNYSSVSSYSSVRNNYSKVSIVPVQVNTLKIILESGGVVWIIIIICSCGTIYILIKKNSRPNFLRNTDIHLHKVIGDYLYSVCTWTSSIIFWSLILRENIETS